ncbi:MAG: hypothetical protein N2490_08660 [Ignavibacteria bacterium]|nr:hypothetical protein [Ignavibacteria bacterium]
MKTTKCLLTALILFFITTTCFSQKDTADKTNKFRIAYKKKLIEQVGLSEEVAEKYLNIQKEYFSSAKAIGKKRKELREYIESNPEASDIGKKLDELFALDEEAYKNRKNYITAIKEILTPEQIAKTMILEKQTRKMMKEKSKDKKDKKK